MVGKVRLLNLRDQSIYSGLYKYIKSFAAERNIVGLKGHRSVGGFRASTYNACSIDDVKTLVKCMQDFEKEV